jgi:hypothetical protein
MAKITKIVLVYLLLALTRPCLSWAGFSLGENGPKVSGFAELMLGIKLVDDNIKHDKYNVFEQRLQLKTSFYPEWTQFLEDSMAVIDFRGDFVLDQYFEVTGDFDLRELNFAFTPGDSVDIKIGRQIFTWGTGDYLFINDLFPKDYISFFSGRDDEYLKKPSDGLKFSFYPKAANIDLIAIPLFESNNYPRGRRLSFFDPFSGRIAGGDAQGTALEPSRKPKNAELAARIYRNFGRYETALYAFRGFYKMPRGYLSEADRQLFFPRLDAYGFSLRGPALGGIANFEFGYYNSRQDSNGDNRLIENSKTKCLLGYAKDLGRDWRVGAQYLYEQTLDYDRYKEALLPGDIVYDEHRHLLTLRITKLYKNQTVAVNLFTFVSPSDRDIYLRPNIAYNITDNSQITLGANLIWGEDPYTEFGQMEKNKNIYLRLRYSF